jgi:hypothetical protein
MIGFKYKYQSLAVQENKESSAQKLYVKASEDQTTTLQID